MILLCDGVNKKTHWVNKLFLQTTQINHCNRTMCVRCTGRQCFCKKKNPKKHDKFFPWKFCHLLDRAGAYPISWDKHQYTEYWLHLTYILSVTMINKIYQCNMSSLIQSMLPEHINVRPRADILKYCYNQYINIWAFVAKRAVYFPIFLRSKIIIFPKFLPPPQSLIQNAVWYTIY